MLLALSSLFGQPGGIPSFNRLLLRAAADFVKPMRQPLHVIALTDAPGSRPEVAAQPLCHTYVPCGGDKTLFLAEVLCRAASESTVVLGHVNLSPLGVLFRNVGVIAHGTDVWAPLPRLRRVFLRRARVVAGVSEHTLAQLQKVQGVSEHRCQRVINALDEHSLALALAPACVPTDTPLRIVAVSRLWLGEPKGLDLVLRALPDLPHVEFEMVGDGAARPALMALAQNLGVAHRVQFSGCLSEADKHAALSRSHALVLPSSGEGFGIVYLEAMAHGLPCLAANVGGAKEVVLDGETGLVVSPDVEGVRTGLLRLFDPALRRRLGEAGRQRVQKRFTYPAFYSHAAEFFARLGPINRGRP